MTLQSNGRIALVFEAGFAIFGEMTKTQFTQAALFLCKDPALSVAKRQSLLAAARRISVGFPSHDEASTFMRNVAIPALEAARR